MITGRCHCGKIKYQFETPSEFCSHCHCESCRRTHGSAFVTWTSVSDDKLKIFEGKEFLKSYESSPQIVWYNCGHCFSPLFQKTRHSPGRTYITVASLNEALDRLPECHVSIEEKVDWLIVGDGLPQYREKASDKT